RKSFYEVTKIDPAYYMGISAYANAVFLSMCPKDIQIFNKSQETMADQIEKMIRGGISCIFKREHECKENEHIFYVDANALYQKAMQFKMPYGDYEYIEVNEKNIKKVLSADKESE